MPKALRSKRHRHLQKLLVESRKNAGLTQAVLAERLDRPQSFVAKYQTAERRLDVVEFLDVAEAIGTDPANALQVLQG